MPIVGFSFNNIVGTRKKMVVNQQITTNSTPRIVDVKSREVDALGKSSLVVGFEFLTSYTPDIGEIRLEGELLYLSEDTEKLLKMWKKDKKLPEDISIEILNNLFRVCLLKVSNISDELQLPL